MSLRLISKILIKMKVSLGVPLLDSCLVTNAKQLSKILQFIFITNTFWKKKPITEAVVQRCSVKKVFEACNFIKN